MVIEYKPTGDDPSASLDQLSASTGLSWMNKLRNDTALAREVDWQTVNAEFREWYYKSHGLTEAGAALVAALRLEAASILGEHAAETIGAAYHGGDTGKLPQLIVHAALGCATGALASGACTGGVVGRPRAMPSPR